ncbi:hypothetical protein PNA2_0546 [Pyrococcus sp. NA2]|uniref:hypothetical protein n=1 Tax=Pyrococcus sp. (strain NA2) TaxID=342949 RepID=UPI000209AB4B|nr:hypothetical protein [Pyrococcus sp. NA2]AEC51461.1 hypothetical protein PNA2_0546 [Pyrococcus sp. NA2]
MKFGKLGIIVLALLVLVAGCIKDKTTTQTRNLTPQEIYEKIENATEFGAIWNVTIIVNGTEFASGIGYSIFTGDDMRTFRESRGEKGLKWESYSYINWSNNQGELRVIMKVGNQSKKFSDKKNFNATIAKSMAYPKGELYLLLSKEANFGKSNHTTSCKDDTCIVSITREEGVPFKEMKGNVTIIKGKVKRVSLTAKTEKGEIEVLNIEFVYPEDPKWEELKRILKEKEAVFEGKQ